MAKKIYARARLVKSKRWHIDFTLYDPATGTEIRQRKDFGLNDIEDLAVREAVGERMVKNIDLFLAPNTSKASDCPTLKQAIELAVSIKQKLPRLSSRRKYITVSKPLLSWVKRMQYQTLPVSDFSRKFARAYWDEFTTQKQFRGKTLNNYLDALRSLWNVMDEREMIKENPWERIKPVREEEKLRRTFTEDEKRTVAAAALASDYWLFRGILLQYYCYIRPVELTRLKFRDFDFSTGTVTVQEADAKQYRRVIKTLPASILHYFIDGHFDKFPANFFLFGRVVEQNVEKMAPSATPVDVMRPYKRHAKLLLKLYNAGKLPGGIKGLTWYSWKDTGVSAHMKKTGPLSTKDQAGHRNLAITSIYYHSEEINKEYRSLENDLLSTP